MAFLYRLGRVLPCIGLRFVYNDIGSLTTVSGLKHALVYAVRFEVITAFRRQRNRDRGCARANAVDEFDWNHAAAVYVYLPAIEWSYSTIDLGYAQYYETFVFSSVGRNGL